MRNKLLWVLTVIAAGALIYEAQITGNLAVGWGGDNIRGGGIRIFYSFLAGMLVYRSGWLIKNRLNFIVIGLLLLAVFLIPYSDRFNAFIEPAVVIFYLPLLVILGAGAVGADQEKETFLTRVTEKLCKLSGDISYPLYMIHYPIIWIFMSYVERYKPAMTEKTILTVIGVVMLIGFAYLVLKFLDLPIRRWLKVKFIISR